MSAVAPVDVAAVAQGAARARRDAWRRAFYRMRQSSLSIVGLVLVVLLLVVAAAGNSIAPFPEHITGSTRIDKVISPTPQQAADQDCDLAALLA